MKMAANGTANSRKSDAVPLIPNLSPPLSPEEDILPVPPIVPPSGISVQSHKLWVGNLDKRLTEQDVLKFSSPYGQLVSFKYLMHTAGVDKGEPRGYCFIEYSTREEAERAKVSLNGKIALGKKIIVDWARPDLCGKKLCNLVSETWDASSVSATLQSSTSTAAKIAALEAKLNEMDNEGKGKKAISYYNHDKIKRKHGRDFKIQHPRKPYLRTDMIKRIK